MSDQTCFIDIFVHLQPFASIRKGDVSIPVFGANGDVGSGICQFDILGSIFHVFILDIIVYLLPFFSYLADSKSARHGYDDKYRSRRYRFVERQKLTPPSDLAPHLRLLSRAMPVTNNVNSNIVKSVNTHFFTIYVTIGPVA